MATKIGRLAPIVVEILFSSVRVPHDSEEYREQEKRLKRKAGQLWNEKRYLCSQKTE